MDSQSKCLTQAYNKKDVVIAFSIFAVSVVLHVVTLLILRTLDESHRSPLGWVLTWLPLIAAILIITFLKNRNFVSIGMRGRKWRHSLLTGLMLSLIPVGSMVILGLVFGWQLNTPEYLLFALSSVFVFAASEDIFYVGFIQTRLSGYFKSEKEAIYTGGALFALAHLPFNIITGGIDVMLIMWMGVWFILYQVLVSVYKMYNAIYATIVLHTLINWSTRLWVISDDEGLAAGIWFIVVVPMLFLSTKIWESRLKKRDIIMNKSDKA